jgi:hypothetical protein
MEFRSPIVRSASLAFAASARGWGAPAACGSISGAGAGESSGFCSSDIINSFLWEVVAIIQGIERCDTGWIEDLRMFILEGINACSISRDMCFFPTF